MTATETKQIQTIALKYRPKTPEELEDLCQSHLGLSINIHVDRKTGCWIPVKEQKA